MVSGDPHPLLAELTIAKTRAVIPGQVEPACAVPGLGDETAGGHDHEQADRDVEEEAGPPGHLADQDPADDQAEAGADAGHGTVGGDGPGPLASLGEGRGQQGQGGRREQGRQAEQHQADGEHAAAAGDVARAGAEEQQAAEHQGVGILHPGEPGRGEAHRGLDARQGGEDDRVVQDDHEIADSDDREDGRRLPRGRGSGSARFRHRGAP